MRWPKIKTLNHQVDVIEAKTVATGAQLAEIQKILARIADQLERQAR